ncbi:(R)-stereoselective amidase [Achromobacter spanius]|uniref:carbon-nitrogen hydrolase family protein n=1 Tax=Achromobacter spanius TaxID=217203 RepID=UPI000C2C2E68|nr:carbon-nitrogen hydrolase family protein [Achromobacter spanius]AUA56161.1 amidohydrolase [Achromobacter spanius]CAB3697516.1 (R)-stereoselective amidase [Achromobacter spanius]SPT39103.1 (R)-stereoselective amidase [Achromobacter denitrificans]VEE56291.1 (R)-stereoselective amidase [Achromobacter spanius]
MTAPRIRLIQPTLVDGDVAGNLAKLLRAIDAASGQTDLIVFPETSVSGFPTPDNVAELAEPMDGPSVTSLRQAARQARVSVAFGFAEVDGGRYFNTGVLIDEAGQVLLRYRKTMLYDSDQDVFEPGTDFPVCQWRGMTLGMLICFDIEFPAPARALGRQRVDLTVLLDGMMHPYGHVHRHAIPIRALDNQMHIVMANRVGPGERYEFSGESQAADPSGGTVALAPAYGEAVIDLTLDIGAPARARAAYPGNGQAETG